ncbi:MAG: triose-phosphate isomerase [Bdellovibrionales bacterium]
MQKSPLIVANWKMKGGPDDLLPYIKALEGYDAVLCPSMPLVGLAAGAMLGSSLRLGAQDCHAEAAGAFTGDTSATVLAALGCEYVMVGHSERRRDHHETDEQVWAKAAAAHTAGLKAIVCVGEKAGEDVEQVLARQLAGIAAFAGDSLILAYEPVYAIGTGKVPTADDIQARHTYIKVLVEKLAPTLSISILYGGSVNPENAAVIMKIPGVSGALVGTASFPVTAFKGVLDAVR